jgi:hypothetical protein
MGDALPAESYLESAENDAFVYNPGTAGRENGIESLFFASNSRAPYIGADFRKNEIAICNLVALSSQPLRLLAGRNISRRANIFGGQLVSARTVRRAASRARS